MEAIFENLKKQGKNSVDNLITWMQDAKLIQKEKAAEDKVRKMFEDVKDQKDVPFDKFKQVVGKVASEQTKSLEEFSKQLGKETPKVLNAVTDAASSAAKSVGGALKNVLK